MIFRKIIKKICLQRLILSTKTLTLKNNFPMKRVRSVYTHTHIHTLHTYKKLELNYSEGGGRGKSVDAQKYLAVGFKYLA